MFAIIFLLIPAPAFAWGAEGHEIIASIAARELTPVARAQVAQLLGREAMLIHDSNWADEIRGRRPKTGPWHYVDIPLGAQGYDVRRDCRANNCVVAQITRDLNVLGNNKQPRAARTEALRFLIHFVGDIHQPLHAVDNDDHGGNAVRVYLAGDRTNLHRIWDTEVVEAFGFDAGPIAAAVENAIPSAQIKAWQAGSPADWANESHRIARDQIYPVTHGRRSVRLSPVWLRAQAPTARLQMEKAGVRLAWLLNRTLR
ncbi:MAG TPA: S1/P1 nuclease [Rhizomicrobium sp.]